MAIAFLFSYQNPDHEKAAAEIISELVPGVSLSLSHQVATEWREYERTASAVMDAYIAPPVSRYMADLSTRLADQGMPAPLRVMQSNGGVISARAASERPLQTLLSGPVGGAAGGVALSEVLKTTQPDLCGPGRNQLRREPDHRRTGRQFPFRSPRGPAGADAGGGHPHHRRRRGVPGLPGGGGTAGGTRKRRRPARAGLLRDEEGPNPPSPTPTWLWGGSTPTTSWEAISPSTPKATDALLSKELGRKLDLDGNRLALGIIEVINAKMSQAIRTLTVERGIEPREFSLVAFGGAGPMHAVALAQELGIAEVIVPPRSRRFLGLGNAAVGGPPGLQRGVLPELFADLDTDDLHARFARLGEVAVASLLGEGVGLRSDLSHPAPRHALPGTGTHPDRHPAQRRLPGSRRSVHHFALAFRRTPTAPGTATPTRARPWRR